MFAAQAPSHGSANGIAKGSAKNLVELTAHWRKLQDFLRQWGSQQERLLMCDDASDLLDAAQIHLLEAAHCHDTDKDENTSSAQDATPLHMEHRGEAPLETLENNTQVIVEFLSSTQENDAERLAAERRGAERLAATSWLNNQDVRQPDDYPAGPPVAPKESCGDNPYGESVGEDGESPVAAASTEGSGTESPSPSRNVHKSHLQNFRKSRSGLEKPPRPCQVYMRKIFDASCGIVIFANAIIIGVGADYAIKNPLLETPVLMASCELSFILFYIFEICVRVNDQRRNYFAGAEKWWNVFDVVLVAQGIFEQLEKAVVGSSGGGLANLSFLRLFRLMKMLKLLRIIRLMRMFRELRLILSSISACLTSMLWTGLLILAITYLFGVVFIQACTGYMQLDADDIDPDVSASIQKYWGTVPTSILSLYMAGLSGQDWEAIAYPLGHVGMGGVYYFLFIIYIAIFAFVVMNVVSSIFLESILTHADKDQELTIERQMEQKEDYIHRLQELFQLLDDGAIGEISYEKFTSELHSPRMQAFAESLEIDISDAKNFFKDISDGGKQPVDMDTFVVGCIKLKGSAKSVDLIELKYATRKVTAEQNKASKKMQETATAQHKELQEMYHKMHHDLHKMATSQYKGIVELKAFDQIVHRDLTTLATYVKQVAAPGAGAGAPATTQDERVWTRSHLQL